MGNKDEIKVLFDLSKRPLIGISFKNKVLSLSMASYVQLKAN